MRKGSALRSLRAKKSKWKIKIHSKSCSIPISDNSKLEKNNYYVVRSNPENRMMELNGYKFCGNFYVLLRYQNENNQPKLDPVLVEKLKEGDLSIFSGTMKIFD